MPLTPAEVHNVVFKKPPIGKRGYDEEEVDAFLDIIEVELARLIEENADLMGSSGSGAEVVAGSPDGSALAPTRDENRKLTARIGELETALNRARQSDGAGQGESAALAAAREENKKLASRIGELETSVTQARQAAAQAQQEAGAKGANAAGSGPATGGITQLAQAERVLALAQQAADEQTAAAKEHSDKTMAEAKAHQDKVHNEARAFREKTVADAQARADDLERDSRAKAASTLQDAEQRATQITSQLEQRKVALEKRLEELSTFEHEYRSRLKSYLESQLRDLDTSSRVEPVGPTVSVEKQSAEAG